MAKRHRAGIRLFWGGRGQQGFNVGQNQRCNPLCFIFYNGFPHIIFKSPFPHFLVAKAGYQADPA